METIYFYLVKYYNCFSEKHGEKKKSLVNLTYTCSRIIRTYRRLTSCAFISAITLKPLPKQKIRFFQLYWFSYRKDQLQKYDFPLLTNIRNISANHNHLHRHIGHPPRFHGLVPRFTQVVRQYFVLFRLFCVVFR